MPNNAHLIYDFVHYKLKTILGMPKAPLRAALANMRRGVDRIPGDSPELWNLMFSNMPESMFSKDGQPTREEWACHIALSLFATHQQGRDPDLEPMTLKGQSLGKAVRRLVPPGDDDALDRIRRRFCIMATSSDLSELSRHLRSIVQLLRTAGVALDYPALAQDLFYYQFLQTAPSVRLRWGQDFCYVTEDQDSDAVSEGEGKDDHDE